MNSTLLVPGLLGEKENAGMPMPGLLPRSESMSGPSHLPLLPMCSYAWSPAGILPSPAADTTVNCSSPWEHKVDTPTESTQRNAGPSAQVGISPLTCEALQDLLPSLQPKA